MPSRDAAAWTKLVRFCRLYGVRRALAKACGRTGRRLPLFLPWPRSRTLGLIGCGQFAFSTLCFFIAKSSGKGFAACFDPDRDRALALARFYGIPAVCDSADQVLDTPGLDGVMIASNHGSHADYAVAALERGLDVHVEKPVAVTGEQLSRLDEAVGRSAGRLFAGYNRPFAPAVQTLGARIRGSLEPLSLSCFVCGHVIPPDHWYRHPDEGSRICGNLGHWLDLGIHLMAVRGRLPTVLDATLAHASCGGPADDNLTLTLVSDLEDLITVTMVSRAEPYEGILEQIALQCGPVMAHIHDFRAMDLWSGSEARTYRYRPKDVGHEASSLQLLGTTPRPWSEIAVSSRLTLDVADMVASRTATRRLRLEGTRS